MDSASRFGRGKVAAAPGGDAAARDGSGAAAALAHQVTDQHEPDERHGVEAVAVEPGLPRVVARAAGAARRVASAGSRRGHFSESFFVDLFFFSVGVVFCVEASERKRGRRKAEREERGGEGGERRREAGGGRENPSTAKGNAIEKMSPRGENSVTIGQLFSASRWHFWSVLSREIGIALSRRP